MTASDVMQSCNPVSRCRFENAAIEILWCPNDTTANQDLRMK